MALMRRVLTISAERLGIWASTLCILHCIVAPVVLSLSVVSAHFLPSEEWTHRTFALVIAMLGVLALIKGFRIHRRIRVLIFMSVGLTSIFAGSYWGDRLPSHGAEIFVMFAGSCFMIVAHRLNHTFCNDCKCSR
jgi:hypothetical protein